MAVVLENEEPLPHLTMAETKFFKRKMKTGLARTAIQGLFHPLNFAKVLIQTGHEPFPLTKGVLYYVAGPDGYCLPNGLAYASRIAQKEGVSAVYRGLSAAMASGMLGVFGSTVALIWLDRKHPELKEKNAKGAKDLQAALQSSSRSALRESLAKTAGLVLASPLRVVLVRRIASYIGGELEYETIIGSLQHIYRNEGVAGFFKGLVPLLIAEWGTIWLMHGLSLALDQAFVKLTDMDVPEEKEDVDEEEAAANISNLANEMEGPGGMRKLIKFAIPFVVNGMTYRYHLVSTLMTINNCGLAAGAIPYAPAFGGWQDCYDFLVAVKGLRRGAKLFFRDYLGPITYRGAQVYASL